MNESILYALAATLGTWFVTALGAATVIFFKSAGQRLLNLMLGFAAGVMIAASFWSLLQPATELAEKSYTVPAWLAVTLGFLGGALFIWISDRVISRIRQRSVTENGNSKVNRLIMLVLSITLHNIPEGLAVGVAFGALQYEGFSPDALAGAITVALGIGLQNFPEGAAVSLPLRREGCSRIKSFLIGQASGIAEPLAGLIGACAVIYVSALLPIALSFAAGAMILVAVHELIPEAQRDRDTSPYLATMGIIAGFAVMTMLDVALG